MIIETELQFRPYLFVWQNFQKIYIEWYVCNCTTSIYTFDTLNDFTLSHVLIHILIYLRLQTECLGVRYFSESNMNLLSNYTINFVISLKFHFRSKRTVFENIWFHIKNTVWYIPQNFPYSYFINALHNMEKFSINYLSSTDYNFEPW